MQNEEVHKHEHGQQLQLRAAEAESLCRDAT